jgi:hypothetical protein
LDPARKPESGLKRVGRSSDYSEEDRSMADIGLPPLYEPVISGFPFYIILLVFAAMFLGFGLLAFYTEVYVKMKPVWGFRSAVANSTPLAIITGMNHTIWMESIEYVAGIFRSLDLPLMWILTSKTAAGQMGGKVNTIFLGDDWNIVHDQDIDYAIVYAARKWNEEHPDKYIKDWETFELHLMNGDLDQMFPEGIKLPPFRIVDTTEIQRYLPKWAAAHHAGYINQEVAKRENKDKEVDKKGFYLMILGGLIIVALCAIGYMILKSA